MTFWIVVRLEMHKVMVFVPDDSDDGVDLGSSWKSGYDDEYLVERKSGFGADGSSDAGCFYAGGKHVDDGGEYYYWKELGVFD